MIAVGYLVVAWWGHAPQKLPAGAFAQDAAVDPDWHPVAALGFDEALPRNKVIHECHFSAFCRGFRVKTYLCLADFGTGEKLPSLVTGLRVVYVVQRDGNRRRRRRENRTTPDLSKTFLVVLTGSKRSKQLQMAMVQD